MAFKASPYFNSPQFAQAAANLMTLFEPPSGADAAGWAAANAKKAEASRLAEQFSYLTNPTNQAAPDFHQRADAYLLGTGGIAPTQSFYAQDANNATQRYGYDTQAATSRSNNAADNARAIRTNAADNARALEVGQINGLADLYKPVGEGEVRPAIPQDVAGRFGVTRELPAEQGREKTLTDEQVKGAILQTLPRSQQEAAAFGNTPVENIVTPNGPRIATRLDAIGQVPYDKPSAGLSVSMDKDGNVTYTMGGSGQKTTEFQGKQNAYVTRMRGVAPIIDSLGGELTDFSQAAYDALPTVGTIKTGNGMLSENYQKASNAGRVFLQSVLRLDSGAAIPPAEEAQYGDVFLPRPGDKPGTVAQKQYARTLALNGVEAGMTPDQILATGRAVLASGGDPNATPSAAAPAAAPAPAVGDMPVVSSPEEAAKLPSGTQFKTPDGRIKVRP